MNEFTIKFSIDELVNIDEARGLYTTEEFIRQAAMYVASQLVTNTTPEQRRGSVPTFNNS